MLKRVRSKEWSVWRAAKEARIDKLSELLAVETHPEAAVNRMHPVKGLTPLMAVAEARNTTSVASCTRILISFGADVTAVDNTKRRNTALHYATYNNKAAVVDVLLEAGANVFARNRRGLTALDLAWRYGCGESAYALMVPIHVHSGWLNLSADVTVAQRERRWCVVLACDAERSTVELCIFRQPDSAHPEARLQFDSNAAGEIPVWSLFEFHVDNVKVLPIHRHFHRHRVANSDQDQAVSGFQGKFAFVADILNTPNDRETWMRALRLNLSSSSDHQQLLRTRQRSESTHSSNFTSSEIHPHGRVNRELGQQESSSSPSLQWTRETAQVGFDCENETVSALESEAEVMCAVCMEAPLDAMCSPCGHTAVCRSCLRTNGQQLEQRLRHNCPLCRAPIEAILPLGPSQAKKCMQKVRAFRLKGVRRKT